MPDRRPAQADLRAALRGVEAFILDADGVLILKGEEIPGSSAALERLDARGIPYRVVTNFSLAHRETLAARFAEGGTPIPADRFITASSAAAAYTLAELPRPAPVRPGGPGRAAGVRRPAPADARGGRGRLGGRRGGRHRRRRRRPLVSQPRHGVPPDPRRRHVPRDAPQSVVAHAARSDARRRRRRRRARVRDRPQGDGPRQAVAGRLPPGARRAARAISGGGSRAGSVAMVGDDPDADVRAAQRVGLRGILVLTGKVASRDAARAGRRAEAPARRHRGIAGRGRGRARLTATFRTRRVAPTPTPRDPT